MSEVTDMLAESRDYEIMKPYWQLVDALMGGVETMRDHATDYLPKFPAESDDNYSYRCSNSKYTNVYGDILGNLASKPFTREVALLGENNPAVFDTFIENVDGMGNHLHVFASDVFLNGLNNTVDWILVDYTEVPESATRADEIAIGARPFWIRIPASQMLAVYSTMINGEEQFIYARFRADETVHDGVQETCRQVVRVIKRTATVVDANDVSRGSIYGPPSMEVWVKSGEADKSVWTLESTKQLSIGVIPLVPFAPGRRVLGKWHFTAPLQSIAELQVEHYQQETNLKNAKELTAFPMFAGNGMMPPKDKSGNDVTLTVGPSAVLYAPPNTAGNHGEWKVLEITAESLTFLATEVKRTEDQMRELGRQPMMQGTSGITQVAAAFASQKASTALQAWTFQLKDSVEVAMEYTAMWYGLPKEQAPSVYVNSDFQISLGDDKAMESLDKMHTKGVISTVTYRSEAKRRNVLSPEFDNEVEDELLLAQEPSGLADGEDLDPFASGLGDPIDPTDPAATDSQGDDA